MNKHLYGILVMVIHLQIYHYQHHFHQYIYAHNDCLCDLFMCFFFIPFKFITFTINHEKSFILAQILDQFKLKNQKLNRVEE